MLLQTSDLVKRRYSTRFNNLPKNFDPAAEPMPSLPPLDKYESQERRAPRPRGGSSGSVPQVDVRALRDPKLSAEQCAYLNTPNVMLGF